MNVQCRLHCWKVRPVRFFILTSWQSAQMLMRRARLFWTRHKCIELRFRVDASSQELRVPSWLPALREKHRKTIRKGPTAFLLIKTDSHLILVAHTEKKSGHQKRFQWRIVTIMPLQNLIKQTFTKAFSFSHVLQQNSTTSRQNLLHNPPWSSMSRAGG